MERPYRNYSEDSLYWMIQDIESAIESGLANNTDYGQLAQLESELEEREWA